MRKGFCVLFLMLAVCLLATTSQADVYKFVDKNGFIFYTDEPKNSKYKLIIRSKRKSASLTKMMENRRKIVPYIHAAAKKHELDPDLLDAVIRVESAYNPEAVSKAGAVGLMQLMPATAKRYGVQNRKDPVENIDGGADYLSDLLELFNADLELALAAYNAGEHAVIKHGNQIPPFKETQNYVTRVLTFYSPE